MFHWLFGSLFSFDGVVLLIASVPLTALMLLHKRVGLSKRAARTINGVAVSALLLGFALTASTAGSRNNWLTWFGIQVALEIFGYKAESRRALTAPAPAKAKIRPSDEPADDTPA